MPQLVIGVLLLVAASYALIYGLTIAVYALAYSVPAGALLWVSSTGTFLLLSQNDRTAASVSVDFTTGNPQLLRSETGTVQQSKLVAASAVGFLLSSGLLYFIGQGIESASGSDAVWLRKAGMAVAWLAMAGATFWVCQWLRGRQDATKVDHLSGLDADLADCMLHGEQALAAASQLAVQLPRPGWGFLQPPSIDSNAKEFEIQARSAIQQQAAEYVRMTSEYQKIFDDTTALQSLLKQATVVATASRSQALMTLVDQAAAMLKSDDLKKKVARRDLDAIERLFAESRSSLDAVARYSTRSDSSREGSKFNEAQNPNSALPSNLRTVEEALNFLSMPADASNEALKNRLNRLSMFYHPDKANGLLEAERSKYEAMMKLVNRARDILEAARRI